MADTSGSGSSIGFTFNDTQQIAEGLTQVHAATEKANTAAGSFKDTMHETAAALAEMDASALKDQATAIAEQASAMAKNFGLSKTETKKLKDNLIGMLTIETALLKARKEGAAVAKEQGVVSKALAKSGEAVEKAWKGWSRGVSTGSIAKQVTGLDLSLGGIIATLVEVYNQSRKIGGLAMIAAGPLGGAFKGGTRAVKQTSAAMGELRGTFAMTYEEAAEVVTQLTRMGFAGDKLAGKSFASKSLAVGTLDINRKIVAQEKLLKVGGKLAKEEFDRAKIGSYGAKAQEYSALKKRYDREMGPGGRVGGPIKEITELTQERLNVEKKITAENERARNIFAGSVGLARELTAIQTVYGVAVSQSGSIIKNLQLEYRATGDEARSMLGSAIQTADEISKSGTPIGVSELLDDWGQILAKTRAYKTDVLGVLGLYKTLMREDIAGKLGFGGMAKSVKMAMVGAVAGMPTQMEIGWQARMGKGTPEGGGSPVARAMEFRDLFTTAEGTAEALKRVLTEVKGMGQGSGEAETRYRTELLLTKVGFPKEAAMDMAKRMAKGTITDEKIKDLAVQQVAAANEAKALQAGWPKARQSLVGYAGTAARATKSVQELIKQWLTDKLLGLLISIRDILDTIAASPLMGGDPEAKKRIEERRAAKKYTDALGTTVTVDQAKALTKMIVQEDPELAKQVEQDKRDRAAIRAQPFGGLADLAMPSDAEALTIAAVDNLKNSSVALRQVVAGVVATGKVAQEAGRSVEQAKSREKANNLAKGKERSEASVTGGDASTKPFTPAESKIRK